jgi:putative mRNA 3-end processing factor
MASGWMRIRGARRRRALDRGFALSDHADWPGLVATIRATGAARVLVTHGSSDALVRWLREQGVDAAPLATEYQGEEEARPAADEEPEAGARRASAEGRVVASRAADEPVEAPGEE